MNRTEVIEYIRSARNRGERPHLNGQDLDPDVLSNLDLQGVILSGPIDNLIGADLRGADLSQADLSDAVFKENPLFLPADAPDPVEAGYNDNTIFPDGFDPTGKGLKKIA